jgi:hypothetical protein
MQDASYLVPIYMQSEKGKKDPVDHFSI